MAPVAAGARAFSPAARIDMHEENAPARARENKHTPLVEGVKLLEVRDPISLPSLAIASCSTRTAFVTQRPGPDP